LAALVLTIFDDHNSGIPRHGGSNALGMCAENDNEPLNDVQHGGRGVREKTLIVYPEERLRITHPPRFAGRKQNPVDFARQDLMARV
jgi:hypothetical protein